MVAFPELFSITFFKDAFVVYHLQLASDSSMEYRYYLSGTRLKGRFLYHVLRCFVLHYTKTGWRRQVVLGSFGERVV
jgi:hypothetical protein